MRFVLRKMWPSFMKIIKKRPHGKFKVGGHSFLIVRDFIEKKNSSFGWCISSRGHSHIGSLCTKASQMKASYFCLIFCVGFMYDVQCTYIQICVLDIKTGTSLRVAFWEIINLLDILPMLEYYLVPSTEITLYKLFLWI